jgi:methyl-accepting chemotaxis protein
VPVDIAGFWSYVHADNEAEGGRITALAKRLMAEYALSTAAPLSLFVDRNDLRWGDAWRERIDAAVAGTTFFIPILTPRYFRSQECRRELLTFWAQAQRSNVDQLLLPIYYATVPELESDPTDEAMALVKARQWEDLRDLRFDEESSGPHRRAVNRLAERISEIVEQVSRIPYRRQSSLGEVAETVGVRGSDVPAEEDSQSSQGEAKPGWLDAAAVLERRLPQLVEALGDATAQMDLMTRATENATAEILRLNEVGASFEMRLEVIERLADQLVDPAAAIRAIGEAYARDLVEISPGYLTLLDTLAELVTATDGELAARDRDAILESLDSIQEARVASAGASAALAGWIQTMDETASISRTLRLPLSDAQAGLRGILDGGDVIETWAQKADALRQLL